VDGGDELGVVTADGDMEVGDYCTQDGDGNTTDE
jgi:hypothetical protein